MKDYRKNIAGLEGLLRMAETAVQKLDPAVKETMISLSKDPGSTLTPDELIVSSHALMGTPMSDELKAVVSELKRTRKTALDLEASTEIPPAPGLIPGAPIIPGAPQLQGESLAARLFTDKMNTISMIDDLSAMKQQSIDDYRKIKKIDKKLARRIGKSVKKLDTGLKGFNKNLERHYDWERYNALKEQFGL